MQVNELESEGTILDRVGEPWSDEEDKLLFKQDMPSEFFNSNHELFNDFFARYKSAGINLIRKNNARTL